MEIKIKSEKEFCDCKSCREELLEKFAGGFKTNCVKGEFTVTDNTNKIIWKILDTELKIENQKK